MIARSSVLHIARPTNDDIIIWRQSVRILYFVQPITCSMAINTMIPLKVVICAVGSVLASEWPTGYTFQTFTLTT
jgi:hypothetical protein